jgi:hypothetical protein
LFEKKGCSGCHNGALALEKPLGDGRLTDVAAALWNHSTQMQQPHPHLTLAEMHQMVTFVWAEQFFGSSGDPEGIEKCSSRKSAAPATRNASSGAPAPIKLS